MKRFAIKSPRFTVLHFSSHMKVLPNGMKLDTLGLN